MAQQDRSGAQPTSEKKQVNCRLQQVASQRIWREDTRLSTRFALVIRMSATPERAHICFARAAEKNQRARTFPQALRVFFWAPL